MFENITMKQNNSYGILQNKIFIIEGNIQIHNEIPFII